MRLLVLSETGKVTDAVGPIDPVVTYDVPVFDANSGADPVPSVGLVNQPGGTVVAVIVYVWEMPVVRLIVHAPAAPVGVAHEPVAPLVFPVAVNTTPARPAGFPVAAVRVPATLIMIVGSLRGADAAAGAGAPTDAAPIARTAANRIPRRNTAAPSLSDR